MPLPNNSLPTGVRPSRKRKAPLDDNGEPVNLNTSKKTKVELTRPGPPKKKLIPEKLAPVQRKPSLGDVPDEGSSVHSEVPHNPRNILESADGSDDDEPEMIADEPEEEPEEDEDAELRKHLLDRIRPI